MFTVVLLVGCLLFLVVVCIMENMVFRHGAKNTLKQMQTIYSGEHEYTSADWRNFPRIDIDFYNGNAAFLEKEKFRVLGDIENVTASNAFPWMRTFIRNLASEDGVVSVGMYYLNPRGLTGLICKLLLRMKARGYVDFETEIRSVWTAKDADGQERQEVRSVFIITSNADLAGRLEQPPQFFALHYPAATPVDMLLSRHLERVENARKVIHGHQTNHFFEIKNLVDSIAMQHRMELIKTEFRKNIGLVNREELRRIGGAEMTDEADRLYEEIMAEKAPRKTPEENHPD